MKIFLLVLSLITLSPIAANAQFGNTNTLDSSYCSQKTFRETIIYIDDGSLIDGRVEWASRLLSKLNGSLIAGERVSVIRLLSEKGQSELIWSGCWPDYPEEKKLEFSSTFYFFKKNPLESIKEQQRIFDSDFNQALTKIYINSKRPANQARFTPEIAPKKQILRALASDDARYSSSQKTMRAIIYSDMMENSNIGSVYTMPAGKIPNYGEQLGTRFRHAVFYAFGTVNTVENAGDLPEKAKAFWTRAFEMMSATLAGFGSDLVVENKVPVARYMFELGTVRGDDKIEGKLSAIVDSDGVLVDSWIGFDRLSIASLTGKFRCSTESCSLSGNTTKGLVTKSESDTVELNGMIESMSGQIGVKSGNGTMFPLKGSALPY